MRKRFGMRVGLIAFAIWVVAGLATTAAAYPAGSGPSGSAGTSSACTELRNLAPQIRKEPELFGACAPSVPQTTKVSEARDPVTAPTGSPDWSVLPWLAVALAAATAIVMVGIFRLAHRQPRPAV